MVVLGALDQVQGDFYTLLVIGGDDSINGI